MDKIKQTLEHLNRTYEAAIACLRSDIEAFVKTGTLPPPERRADRQWCYPELRITYGGKERGAVYSRAFGRLAQPGTYVTTITRPQLFRDYLSTQLSLLDGEYEIEVEVSRSAQEIPFPYVLDGISVGQVTPQELACHFPSTDLAMIGDEIADGIDFFAPEDPLPLALFDGLRTDFSLARLAHYTGTSPEHCQRFILFTNYHRYVDEFVDWAGRMIGSDGYVALSGAGGLYLDAAVDNARQRLSDTAWRRHQMPAYHLIREDRSGITLVNIGVGPSNAKTITDHLAVLRPDIMIMIGHAGGLRNRQELGDFVLATAYQRADHVLDEVLPADVPVIPSLRLNGYLMDALERADATYRPGVVHTTDNRNWEFNQSSTLYRMRLARAVAVDMESATIAANGFRYRIPNATLLCVSDKPLHAEPKLAGGARAFYEASKRKHLGIALDAVDRVRTEHPDGLPGSEVRSVDEPLLGNGPDGA